MRTVGTVSRGVRCPVVKEGDDTAEIRAQESPGGSCIGKMQHNICGADIICLIVYFYKRNEVQIMSTVGTVSRGVRCPVVKEGDDLMQHNICGADIICLIVYFYKRNEVQIMSTVGTVSRGVRCPVVKEGDDLIRIVTEALADMGKEEHITFHEKDIVAVTEAVVARTQGNYASTDDIAKDCRTKFGYIFIKEMRYKS